MLTFGDSMKSPFLALSEGSGTDFALAVIATLISTAAYLAIGVMVGQVFRLGTASGIGPETTKVAATLVALSLIYSLSAFARVRWTAQLAEGSAARLRSKVSARILTLPTHLFEKGRSGDYLALVTDDCSRVERCIATAFQGVRSVTVCLGALAVCYVIDWLLGTALAVLVLVLSVPSALARRPLEQASRQAQQAVGSMFAHATEMLGDVKNIRATGMEPLHTRRMTAEAVAVANLGIKFQQLLAVGSVLATGFAFTLIASIILLAIALGRSSAVDVGAFATFLFCAALVASTVPGVANLYAEMVGLSGPWQRLSKLFRQPLESEQAWPDGEDEALKGGHAVAVRNVSFRYPSRADEVVLPSLSFSVARCETLVVTGASGSGKSTLLALLLGLHPPSSGDVWIDGIKMSGKMLSKIRAAIAFVPQVPRVIAGTVRENLTLGNSGASPEAIIAACEIANCWRFVGELPQGLDTPIGEGGIYPSVGQCQRLALARAILLDRPVVILDEPTSALDADTERDLMAALGRHLSHKAVIIVTHHPESVRWPHATLDLDALKGARHELVEPPTMKSELAQ